MKKNKIQDNFEVLREIHKNPKASQEDGPSSWFQLREIKLLLKST